MLSTRHKDKPNRYGQRYRLTRISKLIEFLAGKIELLKHLGISGIIAEAV